MQLIDFVKIVATKQIVEILDMQKNDAEIFYENLSSGRTLASALRANGYNSACQLDPDQWKKLREWRERYFPHKPVGKKI